MTEHNYRTYLKDKSIIFSKTNEPFGGLSNMAPGYSLMINDNIIPTSEALYQAMRFPLFPDIQMEIIKQKSPMHAKMTSRKYNEYSRQDWDNIRLKVMRWCLEVKLSQNWTNFSNLLRSTGNKPIVELSRKDKVWGAAYIDSERLYGVNALGRLLMDLREKYIIPDHRIECVSPLPITGFMLFGSYIDTVCNEEYYLQAIDDRDTIICCP